MTHIRDRIHAKYCNDPKCDSGEGGEACKNLDFLLDLAEDERVHTEAEKLIDLHMDTVLAHGSQVGQGLALAVKHIDPYEHTDGEYHRKSDGRLFHKEGS
jgi:hypothetical protein